MFHLKRKQHENHHQLESFLCPLDCSILSVIAILPYSLSFRAMSAEFGTANSSVLSHHASDRPKRDHLCDRDFCWIVLCGTRRSWDADSGFRTRGESVPDRVRAILPLSIILGVLSTLIVLGLEFLYFQPAMMKELGDTATALNLQTSQPAAWKGFLASFYGGIAEEIHLRLFVMSFFAWLGNFISKTAEGKPTSAVFWTANILAAVLFGLGHLPATALLVPITLLIIVRAVLLNGLIGVVCGWLYWKRGLESAMISHFSADLVLHVLLAL